MQLRDAGASDHPVLSKKKLHRVFHDHLHSHYTQQLTFHQPVQYISITREYKYDSKNPAYSFATCVQTPRCIRIAFAEQTQTQGDQLHFPAAEDPVAKVRVRSCLFVCLFLQCFLC